VGADDRAAASLKRSGIVDQPDFRLTNYIRDQLAASILRSDYIPIVSGLKGIADEFRQGQNAVLYGYAGGVAGGAATGPVERAAEPRSMRWPSGLLGAPGHVVQRLQWSWRASPRRARAIRSFAQVFEKKKRRACRDYEAMVEAAFQAQDLLDFSRHGSHDPADPQHDAVPQRAHAGPRQGAAHDDRADRRAHARGRRSTRTARTSATPCTHGRKPVRSAARWERSGLP
jgi:hypothetical protein